MFQFREAGETVASVEFYRNVSPPGFRPIWALELVALSFSDITPEIMDNLSEDDIDQIAWFFIDNNA